MLSLTMLKINSLSSEFTVGYHFWRGISGETGKNCRQYAQFSNGGADANTWTRGLIFAARSCHSPGGVVHCNCEIGKVSCRSLRTQKHFILPYMG